MPPVSPRVTGVPGAGAWAHLCLGLLSGKGLPEALRRGLPAQAQPLVAAFREEEPLEDLADALSALAPLAGLKAPPRAAFFGEDPAGRAAAFEQLHRGAEVVLATAEALRSEAPSPEEYAASRVVLRPRQGPRRSELAERLQALGYRRVDFVECPGEYALRGAVVDFFPLEPPEPVRVLFDGDRIETLKRFDVETQAGSVDFLDEAALIPAAGLRSGRSLLDVLARKGFWLAEEGVALEGVQAPSAVVGLAEGLDLGAAPPPAFRADMESLARQCAAWHREGLRVRLFSLNRGEDERLQDLLEGRLPEGAVQFLIGPLRKGFVLPSEKLAVLSSAEIFERSYRPPRRWEGRHAGGGRLRWGELRKGDYVVHEAHGVARYLGLQSVSTATAPVAEPLPPQPEGRRILGRGNEPEPEAVMDCLTLEFRGGDRLFIPMTDFRQVQKFVGAEGHRPRLSSLDSKSWEDVKDRVREGVRELAGELLRLQAQRAAVPGRVFEQDNRMEEEFAESFPFEETPDQRKAIEDARSDMQSGRPMDRVVVGDVGFGKTEVAMRAALKCAASGAQTAVLVPTTILADQHSRTFRARFADYPVRVETLSRFQTPAAQRKALEALASGAADIVVGTHRLLSPDVRFKDLGLLVIDEEHRFGVKDKERIKALRKDVHCLTLSATPIPRTLYQSLSGLRAVSLIRSAPVGRQPITTAVRPYEERHVLSAIEAELARGGQVFYVHNRVRTLPARVEWLRSKLKGVRIAMAHGQMRSDQLEKTMWEFFERKHDVLAASTIIESGLDIPSVNTLLIENAHEFGLSQLYQLRGRIGRERQRAVCCLYYPGDDESMAALSEEARARLQALKEFTQLGSGLQLAMRDLEIRGAGDLLGSRQHGYLNSVGLESYCQMLHEEVERLSKKKPQKAFELPPIDIGVPAFLPEDYLPGDLERIELYKRLLGADAEKLQAIEGELADLSGPPPEPVKNLFRLMRVRRRAGELGVRVVAERAQGVELWFHPDSGPPAGALKVWMDYYAGRIEFLRSKDGDGFRIRPPGREPLLAWLEGFLAA